MTLMIRITSAGNVLNIALSGRIRGEDVNALERLMGSMANGHKVILDLKEVRLVDRDVVRFLARCESQGARLKHCPLYVREWIVGESSH